MKLKIRTEESMIDDANIAKKKPFCWGDHLEVSLSGSVLFFGSLRQLRRLRFFGKVSFEIHGRLAGCAGVLAGFVHVCVLQLLLQVRLVKQLEHFLVNV